VKIYELKNKIPQVQYKNVGRVLCDLGLQELSHVKEA